ncbi:17845_t:CDS:2 [Rhizophagus irregularis]|nr:17845_t:CDS:2 [Rhizophagus irregularis]
MEFINAPIGHNNNLSNESHPQAYNTSRLLGFTSKELNEILESKDSPDLDDCIVLLGVDI